MLHFRPVIEVLKWLSSTDILDFASQTCRFWSDICKAEELWLSLGEDLDFRMEKYRGETFKQCFDRCNKCNSTLPCVQKGRVLSFQCWSEVWREKVISEEVKVGEGSFCLFIAEGNLLVCGGGPLLTPWSCVYQVQPCGDVNESYQMTMGRRNHGACSFKKDVYVFGGIGAGFTPLQSCEKLTFTSFQPEKLPDMNETRFAFTPCCDNQLIFLSGGWGNSVVEAFCPFKMEFSIFPIAEQESSRSVSVLRDNSLVILYQDLVTLVNLKTHETTRYTHKSNASGSNRSPALIRGDTIWSMLGQQVWKFDLKLLQSEFYQKDREMTQI